MRADFPTADCFDDMDERVLDDNDVLDDFENEVNSWGVAKDDGGGGGAAAAGNDDVSVRCDATAMDVSEDCLPIPHVVHCSDDRMDDTGNSTDEDLTGGAVNSDDKEEEDDDGEGTICDLLELGRVGGMDTDSDGINKD